jgi:hypothetical protein
MKPNLEIVTAPPNPSRARLQKVGDLEFLACPECGVMQAFTEYDWPGEHVVVCPICWENIEVVTDA